MVNKVMPIEAQWITGGIIACADPEGRTTEITISIGFYKNKQLDPPPTHTLRKKVRHPEIFENDLFL